MVSSTCAIVAYLNHEPNDIDIRDAVVWERELFQKWKGWIVGMLAGSYQRNQLCYASGAILPRMDKSRAPGTDTFRISDYLGHATERELALSPHAPRDPSDKNRPMLAFHDCMEYPSLSDEELMFRSLPRGEDR